MTQTIDKLIYALDADTSALKARFAESEAAAAATGQKMGASFSAPLKAAASAAATDAAKLKAALGDVDKAVTSTHGSTSMATREFRALFDELSSGRTRMVPGTLAIIATRVFGVTGATLAWTAAIAAVPIAFAVAAAQAEASMARIRTAIALTGNLSGLTPANLSAITGQLTGSGSYSTMGANSFVAGATRAGIPAGMMGQGGIAAANYSLATGAKSEESDKLLDEMFNEPAKAAKELNEQLHLLSTAQVRQIEDLEKSGDTLAASKIILDAFSDRTAAAAAQASTFTKALNAAEVGLGKFWFHLGGGITDQDQLANLKDQLSGALKDNSGGYRDAQIAVLRTQIAAIESKYPAPKPGAPGTPEDRLIGSAMSEADKQSGSFAAKLKSLQDELALDNQAVTAAQKVHSQFTDAIIKQRDAVASALKNQRDPSQEAALRAQEERRIAATPEVQRAKVEAEIAAQRTYRENAANPSMAPYASSILSSQMSVAGLNKHDLNAAAEELKKFAAVTATVTERMQILSAGNTGLAGEVAAGGNPLAMAAAKRGTEVADELAKARKEETGLTKQQIALLEKQLAQLPQELALRDSLKAQIAGNSAAYSTQQGLRNAQQRYGAAAGGASSDDIRDLEIAQQTLDELVKDGLDPTTEAFKKLFDTLIQGRTQTAELTQRMQENAKSGSAFASDITNPLTTALEGKYKKGSDFYRAVGGNVADTGIKTFITDPLQKGLSSMFGGLFGLGGKPDGSMNNPFYVTQSPIGAVLGGGSGGGGLLGSALGGLGSLVGLGGKSSGGGIFGTIAQGIGSLFGGGLASGGWVDPGKFYVVGENGPEILGPGTNGLISPMSSAPDVGQSSTPTTLNTHVSSTITVKGMGDQDILAKAQRGAQETVRMGIEANNKALGRTQRGSLINSNKRALV